MSIPGFSQFFTDKTGGKLRKGIAKYEGFVNFYHDETTDKIYLEIAKLDQEFYMSTHFLKELVRMILVWIEDNWVLG